MSEATPNSVPVDRLLAQVIRELGLGPDRVARIETNFAAIMRLPDRTGEDAWAMIEAIDYELRGGLDAAIAGCAYCRRVERIREMARIPS